MRDQLRLSQLQELTDDAAARRVPRVVTIDPLRSAIVQTLGQMDADETLDVDDALEQVFVHDEPLRVACARRGIDGRAVIAAIVTDRIDTNLRRLARVERAVRFAAPLGRVDMTRPSRVAEAATQSSREDTMDTTETSATARLLELARAEQEKMPTLSDVEAQSRVARKHPDLYLAASREASLTHNGETLAGRDSSAAADALGWKPITFPTQPLKVTVEKKTPVSAGGETVSSAWKIIEDTAAQIMAATGCSKTAAINSALKEKPHLYTEYVAAFRRQTGGLDLAPGDHE